MFKKISTLLILSTFTILLLISCKNEVLPKPSGHLNLEYPEAEYKLFTNNCPFEFEINNDALLKEANNCNLVINYPKMKATIHLSYKPVTNNINLLLRDAQKLTYEHVIKADDILEQPYLNKEKKVYGMFYQINGNAATNAQFYATDSTKHFITGSVYFYAKPNFDSIMPAASYIKNDMQKIIETIKWK